MDKPSLISYFNQLADRWDTEFPADSGKLRCFAELCDLKEGARILDAASGTGSLEPFLLEKNPSRILAVDFSPEMVRIAKQNCFDPRVEFRCADIMEVAGEEFDCAIICGAFPLFENRGSIIRQLHNLLAPGGRAIICHPQGRSVINSNHDANAMQLTMPLPAAKTLTISLNPYFDVDTTVDSPELYVVSGVRIPIKMENNS